MSNETETAVVKNEKANAKVKEDFSSLEAMVKYQKRLLGLARIRTLACVVIAAVFVLAAILIGPRLDTTLNDLQSSMANLNDLTEQLNDANLPGLMKEVQVLVEQGQVGISQALLAVDSSMKELSALDIASLNSAITDFADVSKVLADSTLVKMLRR